MQSSRIARVAFSRKGLAGRCCPLQSLRTAPTSGGVERAPLRRLEVPMHSPVMTFGAVAAMALMAAFDSHNDQLITAAAAVKCEAPSDSSSKNQSNFALVTAVDAKEEMEKVRLAQILHDLHALANENQLGKKSRLRRFVTMIGWKSGDKTKEQQQHAQAKAQEEQQEERGDDNDDDASNVKLQIGDVISLQGVDLANLSKEDCKRIIEGIASGSKLEVSSLQSLVKTATVVLMEQPNTIDISTTSEPVSVIGDLHGSLYSLTHILQTIQFEDRVVVFDGDFVDRGDYSLEVLLTLLVLKLTYPKNVCLLRGNHEDIMIASAYGFQDEIRRKYGDKATSRIWDSIGELFGALPLAAVTNSAFICHGGIPNKSFDLKRLQKVPRKVRFAMKSTVNPVSRDEELLSGIVWSDPIDEETRAIKNNPRGVGVVFGTRVAEDFLKRHNLRYIVRGHEVVENGVFDLKCGSGTSVITVFSAAAYPAGSGTNQGAILHLNPDGSYTQESYSRQDAATSTQQAKQEYIDQALKKVRVMIGCNRSKLEKASATVESSGKVTVTKFGCQ